MNPDPTTPLMKYQVVEITHGRDSEWQGVELFATLAEAQAFATVHYYTQIGVEESCTCDDCANGWLCQPDWWKSYEVAVWDANDEVVPFDTCECPNCENSEGECLKGFCRECLESLDDASAAWGDKCEACLERAGELFTTCDKCGDMTVQISPEGMASEYCDKCEVVETV